MRVMISYGSVSNGGAEKVIVCLANYFAEKGDEVSIVVADDGKCGYILDNRVKVISHNTMGISNNAFDVFRRELTTITKMRKTISRINPDIILCMDPRYAFEAKLAGKGICSKVIGSERSNPYAERTGKKDRLFVSLSGYLNGFIFQTNGAKSYYPGRIQKRSTVISNGLFEDINAKFIPFDKRAQFEICATGRLAPVKRYDVMINAIKLVKEQGYDVRLHIYGEGDYRQEIERIITENKLNENIILEGRRKQIYPELMKYRYFLLTSDNEGMPNGLIDAMACGCACISTDCDFGPSELINNGVNGFLVSVNNPEEISNCIIMMINDNTIGYELSRNAITIRETLSKENILGKYYQYIEETVNGI